MGHKQRKVPAPHLVPAGNGKSVLEAGTGGAEMPAQIVLLFRGGASNSVLAYEIRGLSKMLSKIAAAIGMLPDWKSDTASSLFFVLVFFFFFFTE